MTGVADGIQMSGRSNKIISSPAVTRHPDTADNAELGCYYWNKIIQFLIKSQEALTLNVTMMVTYSILVHC